MPSSTPSGIDRLAGLAVGAELAHVLHRDHDLEVQLLAGTRVDELDLPARASHEPTDLLERPLRGGQADALERPRDDALEPLQRDRQVGAALRPGHRMHLVEDHRLDRAQHLAPLRREQQEERLRRGDEDVGRRAQHLLALALRRVARAHTDREARAHPGERPAQVALDVVVERLQRRHVEQAQPCRPASRRGGRGRAGTRRASSRTRSAPARARACRSRSRARRVPAPVSGRRRHARTRLAQWATGHASGVHGASVAPRPRLTEVALPSDRPRRRERPLRHRRRGRRHRRVRARRATLRGPRAHGVPARGGPRLRSIRGGAVAGRDARSAQARLHARLGHGRRGRPLARCPGDRRQLGAQRVRRGSRVAGRLRRMGR